MQAKRPLNGLVHSMSTQVGVVTRGWRARASAVETLHGGTLAQLLHTPDERSAW
jgi:hypothetical protein